MQAYADLDALIELFGHIRAENEALFPVSFKLASEVKADDLSGHLVLLGGVAWNDLTRHLLRSLIRLPVRQFESPDLTTGEIFAVGRGENEQRFEPEWAPDNPKELVEDVGLLARVRNPYNSSRTLTLCNGIHSRGVLGAVRALTDVRVRDANESYLAERFGSDEYAILMRVPVFQGKPCHRTCAILKAACTSGRPRRQNAAADRWGSTAAFPSADGRQNVSARQRSSHAKLIRDFSANPPRSGRIGR